MQKVVGSNPIIRFSAAKSAGAGRGSLGIDERGAGDLGHLVELRDGVGLPDADERVPIIAIAL
jgi:hypothetical protein